MTDVFQELTELTTPFLDPRVENSRAARKQSLPKAGTDKAKILHCIKTYGKPIHAKHIAQLSDVDYYAVQRRVSEMVRDGLITPNGKKDKLTLYSVTWKGAKP